MFQVPIKLSKLIAIPKIKLKTAQDFVKKNLQKQSLERNRHLKLLKLFNEIELKTSIQNGAQSYFCKARIFAC